MKSRKSNNAKRYSSGCRNHGTCGHCDTMTWAQANAEALRARIDAEYTEPLSEAGRVALGIPLEVA